MASIKMADLPVSREDGEYFARTQALCKRHIREAKATTVNSAKRTAVAIAILDRIRATLADLPESIAISLGIPVMWKAAQMKGAWYAYNEIVPSTYTYVATPLPVVLSSIASHK